MYIFFNMDISLIIALISLEMCIPVYKVCMEGRVSQNVDLGLSFCFMLCRRWNLKKKNGKKYQSFPFFVIQSKPGPKLKM